MGYVVSWKEHKSGADYKGVTQEHIEAFLDLYR